MGKSINCEHHIILPHVMPLFQVIPIGDVYKTSTFVL